MKLTIDLNDEIADGYSITELILEVVEYEVKAATRKHVKEAIKEKQNELKKAAFALADARLQAALEELSV